MRSQQRLLCRTKGVNMMVMPWRATRLDGGNRRFRMGPLLVADKDTSARFPADVDPGAIIRRHGFDHGVRLYSRRQNAGRYGDWLLIAPPLVIDERTCDELIDRLDTTIAATMGEVRAAVRR